MCELVKFDRAQSRTFSEVCANDQNYEKSIFEIEDQLNAHDDSDDGINNTGIISTLLDKITCNYHVSVSQELKDRTLAFFNRVRWLTGYQRKLTWDDTKDNETCQCSFVNWASEGQNNGLCSTQAPKWEEGCRNSNKITFSHNKMSNGILKLYDEGLLNVDQRNLMLSQHLTKTSMCTVSQGKRKGEFGFPHTDRDFFTMNLQFNENNEEKLPFIAVPPPGFIPYYMMPSVASLFAKDIKSPKATEFKVYFNGSLVSGNNGTQYSSREKYHGYTFDLTRSIMRNYSHLVNNFVFGASDLFFPPGSVFGFEATNNGKTYAWNTTLVDCTRDAGKYPDPIPASTSSNPKSESSSNTDTTTRPMPDIDGTSSQKSGLSQKQKIGIGVGVTVGVAVVAGAVIGGLAFSGVIGGGSSVVTSGAAAGV